MIKELTAELKKHNIDIVKVVDISLLSRVQNRGYSTALIIGKALSPEFIRRLSKEHSSDGSEFGAVESNTDKLAEWTADYIKARGYKSYAQSENNLYSDELFDDDTKTSPLPHKVIALMAGLGIIGKNNLLVTEEYGCAISMCTILTNAPLPTENKPALMPKCGDCTICKDICPVAVLHGTTWEPGIHRDQIVDVYHCITCLKCLAYCPWTQRYMELKYNK